VRHNYRKNHRKYSQNTANTKVNLWGLNFWLLCNLTNKIKSISHYFTSFQLFQE